MSIDAISDRVNLSRNACWRRIKMLEQERIIKQRVAILDANALGCELQALVMIRALSHEVNWAKKFHNAVKEMPQIVSAYRLSGDMDYALRVRLEDMQDYDRFYKDFISRIDVADMSASFVMEEIKESTELPI